MLDRTDGSQAQGQAWEWTAEVVRRRLGDAIRLVQRTTGRVGPKGFGQAMPDYEYSAIDRWFQSMSQDAGAYAAARNHVRIVASAEEMSAADEALAWVPRFVRYERPRRGLQVWLQSQAHDIAFRDAARHADLSYRSAIRWRDEAVAAVVDGLNKNQ